MALIVSSVILFGTHIPTDSAAALRKTSGLSSWEGVAFPTYTKSGPGPGALVTGRLRIESRCLIVAQQELRSLLLIWPDGMQLVTTSGGLGIANAQGRIKAHVGDRVNVGGGGVARRQGNDLASIPPRCRGWPYWLVTSLGRAPR